MVLKVWSPDQAICSDQEIVKTKNSPRATGSKALGGELGNPCVNKFNTKKSEKCARGR